jgi:hypothetical protein
MIGERLAQLAAATYSAIALLRSGRRTEDVAQAVLERLANAAGCEWGAYWALDPLIQRLQAVASWSALGPKGERLEQDARVRTLAISQGNAGQVWRSRKPIWTTNLVLDMCLPRSLDASEAGLRGGVWFAVKTDTAIYGVIELLAQALPYKNSEALAVVERAGFRLGYVIEELRSEPSRLH